MAVVAGGWQSAALDNTDAVQILNLKTNQWRLGNGLPFRIHTMASVPLAEEDSFALVGGQVNGKVLNTVFKYDPANDSWELLSQRLSQPRSPTVSFAVKRSAFPNCD